MKEMRQPRRRLRGIERGKCKEAGRETGRLGEGRVGGWKGGWEGRDCILPGDSVAVFREEVLQCCGDEACKGRLAAPRHCQPLGAQHLVHDALGDYELQGEAMGSGERGSEAERD